MTGCRFCEGKLAGKLKGDDWHAGALTNACGVSKINHVRLITKFFLVTTQCYHFPNHVVLEKSRHFHMHSGVSKINQPRLVTKFFSVQRATMLPFSKHDVLGKSRHSYMQSGTNSLRFLAGFLPFCSHFWLGDLNVGLLISWKCPLLCCSSLFAWINNQVFLVLWNVKTCFWPHVYYCTLKKKKNISERNRSF